MFGGFELGCDCGCDRLELVHDRPELGSGAFWVGFGEDRADQRGDHEPVLVFGVSEEVSHGVNAASLPYSALEDPPDRSLEVGVCVGDHQADPVKVAVLQRPKKLGPERLVLGVPNINTEHFAVPVSTEPGGDHHSFGDDLAAFSDVDAGRVQPEVYKRLMAQIPVAEHRHASVDVLADPRHRALGDPGVATQRFDEVVDLPRGGAGDVRGHDHRPQRLVDPPAGLQQLREERPLPQLRDPNGDISGRGGDQFVAVPVPKVRPLERPFVGFGADPSGQFGFDQLLDRVAQDVGHVRRQRRINSSK